MSADCRLQFVDTNVLVYAYDWEAGPKHEQAGALVQRLWRAQVGCLSVQVLQEFYASVTRARHPVLDPSAAASVISDLAQWNTHCPNPNDVLEAIRLHRRYHISFWDAMVINSAAQLGCDVVWSEDLNSGQSHDGVVVRNPFA